VLLLLLLLVAGVFVFACARIRQAVAMARPLYVQRNLNDSTVCFINTSMRRNKTPTNINVFGGAWDVVTSGATKNINVRWSFVAPHACVDKTNCTIVEVSLHI
jgi:hypothetical protein